MGTYVMKVTANKAKDALGRSVNLVAFAYKPYWSYGSDQDNNRMAFKSGVYTAERFVKNSKNFTGRIAEEADGKSIEWSRDSGGDMYDDQLAEWLNAS